MPETRHWELLDNLLLLFSFLLIQPDLELISIIWNLEKAHSKLPKKTGIKREQLKIAHKYKRRKQQNVKSYLLNSIFWNPRLLGLPVLYGLQLFKGQKSQFLIIFLERNQFSWMKLQKMGTQRHDQTNIGTKLHKISPICW